MHLPKPVLNDTMSVEKAIKTRRTIRDFSGDPLSLEQLTHILWAAQGVTEEGGFKRAAPSGGALYPLDIYCIVGDKGIMGLAKGVYHYNPPEHALNRISEKDGRREIAQAALNQMWMARAPLTLVITSEYSRICGKYGERGVRYAMIETGHVGQNIFLQAEALGLGTGVIGAFQDEQVIQVMGISKTHEPLLIMPIGKKGD